MKITNFDELRRMLRENKKMRIVVAGAEEEEILLARQAKEMADFILLGEEEHIRASMGKHNIDPDGFKIINIDGHSKVARTAIEMIHNQEADLPMKGLVHTSVFMSAVLDKQNGLKRNRRLSQITVFRNTTLGDVGLTFLTDCAINIEMTLQVKKDIIENAVLAARAFGIECPKVALLGAVETVNEAMSDTLNSAILTQMNRRGQLTGCIVDGPLSLDNAISKEAAQRKGIVSDVAGEADILVGSCLQEANSLSKGLNFYAQFSTASIIVGTEQPIIMTSRTDQQENKLNSIAATCYYQRHVGGAKA